MDTYRIPSESTFNSLKKGNLSRVILPKYALYFNFGSSYDINGFLKYNNSDFVFNFYVLDNAPTTIEIQYKFNNLVYSDFVENFDNKISYQLLKYETFEDFI